MSEAKSGGFIAPRCPAYRFAHAGYLLKHHPEAIAFSPRQPALLLYAAVQQHEPLRDFDIARQFKTGAAGRKIDQVAIDDGRALLLGKDLRGLRDETARTDAHCPTLFHRALLGTVGLHAHYPLSQFTADCRDNGLTFHCPTVTRGVRPSTHTSRRRSRFRLRFANRLRPKTGFVGHAADRSPNHPAPFGNPRLLPVNRSRRGPD